MQDQGSVGRNGRWRALLIESDEAYRAVLTATLQLACCHVDQAETAGAALPALERRSYDLVVWGVSGCDSSRRGEFISRAATVHRLRQKLEPMQLPCRLVSEHGHGYCPAFG